MNIDILNEKEYKDKLKEFFYDVEFTNTYPFEEYLLISEALKHKEVKNSCEIINKSNIFCKIDSHHYAILNLNGIDYIIDIYDDGTIHITGTTLSNWIDLILNSYGDEKTIEEFMEFCYKEFNIPIEYPDYDALMDIENQFLKPLIEKDQEML